VGNARASIEELQQWSPAFLCSVWLWIKKRIITLKNKNMTREEQLQLCRVCKNKKMDLQRGIVCSLTNEKADFDKICPNYSPDEAQIVKNKQVQAERVIQTQEDLKVSGWLAYFLWIGIGCGAILTIISTLISYSDFIITPLWGFLLFLYLLCYVVCAVLTIKAFYKRQTNAVSLARTYIAMLVIDLVTTLIIYAIVDDFTEIYHCVRSFIWACIWFSYLSLSERVKDMIPSITRTWKMTEKMLLVIFTVICSAMCFVYYHATKEPLSNMIVSTSTTIDMMIEAANETLPDNSDPEIAILRVEKENDKIVYVCQFKVSISELDVNELAFKKGILAGIASEEISKEDNEFFTAVFKEGYILCYRYLDNIGKKLVEVDITEEDYKDALNSVHD
jgi:hypothetical protein